MTAYKYLEDVLEANKFDKDQNDETAADRSKEVREKLEDEFGNKIVTIRYSGSIAKATAVANSHDVDLAVHFKHDAFDTLEGMFNAVRDFLKKHYTVREQKVSVGIPSQDVDVVPGRRLNDNTKDYDVNLYRRDTKTRIKTNIVEQIQAVRESDAREVIKLAKIWRDKWGASFKSFALELLSIQALGDFEGDGLDKKMRTVLNFIQDEVKTVVLTDPGNSNNDVAATVL